MTSPEQRPPQSDSTDKPAESSSQEVPRPTTDQLDANVRTKLLEMILTLKESLMAITSSKSEEK
ncbi:MAG: hypothetical protein ABI425_03420 [Patescibacteria group bacterium]